MAERGQLAAFGNEQTIFWSKAAHEVFLHNPNVATPGSENDPEKRKRFVWIKNYTGFRPYNRHDPDNNRWLWRYGTITTPGEIFLTQTELKAGRRLSPGGRFVVMEPSVPRFKAVSVNKQWRFERYQIVADGLRKAGFEVVQFRYPAPYGPSQELRGVKYQIATRTFRHAMAVLKHAALYVGPEGGMHHAAAAFGVPAVVIFGGFISPQVTGYPWHDNLYAGGEPCGMIEPCKHCERALNSISAQLVLESALDQLRNRRLQWHDAKERVRLVTTAE